MTAPTPPDVDATQAEIPKCPICGCCDLKPHCANRPCKWFSCLCSKHAFDKVVYRGRDMHLMGSPTPWGKPVEGEST